MRDFRDAKAMAQALRESLTHKAVTISHSESLELVSKMLGAADWNTLSAMLQADRRDTVAPAARLKTTRRSSGRSAARSRSISECDLPAVCGPREHRSGPEPGVRRRTGGRAGDPARGSR
ncbi:glyoxalase superfamily protein [Bradyrhizobium japonicum]